MKKPITNKVKIVPLSFLRKAVRASASVTKNKNSIHFMVELNVTKVVNEIEKLKKIGKKSQLRHILQRCLL